MKYPSLREYKSAINDTGNINIPFFKSSSIKIFLNKRGLPYMSVGGFGAVFQFMDKNGAQYALKVFTRDAEGREKRYQALHNTLQITKFPFMVDFHYVPDGLKVGKQHYPVVVMQWGKGLMLDQAITSDLGDDNIFQSAPTIGGNLFLLVKTLQEWNMGHGDFQEGNLLIGDDDRIILIDYDGMFVPALEGETANEIGLADYQHPKRDNSNFGSGIDDFALLSILYQLSIITQQLWKKKHGDKRLIMTQKDYLELKKSALIKKGLKSKKKHVKLLANMLQEACKLDPLKIDAVKKIESTPEIMDWLKFTEETIPQENYTSLIKQVVSLTDEQVHDFESDNLSFEINQDTVAPQEEPPPTKVRIDDKKGTWKTVIDFLYEEDLDEEEEDSPKTTCGQTPRMLNRVKDTMMDMLFEKEEDDDNAASAQSTPGPVAEDENNKLSPPPPEEEQLIAPLTDLDNEEKEAETSGKEEKPPAETKPGTKKYDDKTAPVPDWIKKRKRS